METKEDTRGLNVSLILSILLNFMSLGRVFVNQVLGEVDGQAWQPMEKDRLLDIWQEALESGNGDGPEPSEVP